MNTEQVKDKLKKLFAVAENDASTDGEIANAMKAARTLMNLHQIERDDVFQSNDGEINVDNVTYSEVHRYSRYTSLCAWESWLCKFICSFVPGTNYYVTRGERRRNNAGMVIKGKATLITFYGPELDVVFCGEIWDEVVTFISAAATFRYGSALSRGEAASYAEGFAMALCLASKEEVKELEESKDSYALVVVNRDIALKEGGKAWLADNGIQLKKGRGAKSAADKSWSAYEQGQKDANGYTPSSTKKAGLLCN